MSTFASPLSSGKTSPQGEHRVLGKLFTSSGVIGNSLAVSAQDTPDMTVKVSGSATDDLAVLIHTDGHFIQAWNDQDATINIDPNNSGVTKTDAVVAYVNLTAGDATNANNPGALVFVVVRRSSTDTGAPTLSEIETAVLNNPYILLAYVTVANGVASVNSGNITDQRTVSGAGEPILQSVYPVGSIYTNASVSTNPSVLFGFGIWEEFGQGRVLVGVDTTQTEFDTLGEAGGAKTHTLTTDQLPSHNHGTGISPSTSFQNPGGGGYSAVVSHNQSSGVKTTSTGSGQAHNNLQPYITVYMWRRTA